MWNSPIVAAQAQPGLGQMLLPFLIVLAIFYLLVILPAQRQRRRHTQMLSALKTGDRVVTNGGLYGTIVGVRDQSVQLRIADQVKVEVARTAISNKISASGESTE